MKNKFRLHLCFVFMFVLVVASCQVKRPDEVIPEPELENLLYDYHLAKSMGGNLAYDENYKKTLYVDAVFKKHGTTQAVFDSSMVWYMRNTEILYKIYERLSKRMKSEQDEINHLIAIRDNKPTMSQPGDSIDVWPWRRMIRLTGELMSNQYAFVLPADTNYKDRDTLVWEVRYRFLNPILADSYAATMAMQIVYEKDTLNHIVPISKPGLRQIRLFADTLGAIKEVRGFIYYPNEQKGGALLADRFALTRYHCKDSLSVIARDSLNKIESLRIDSLKKISDVNKDIDSLHKQLDDTESVRLTPEEMNRRRRDGIQRDKKPEQIEVEQHIQQEKRERRIMQRRNQQQRRQN